MMPPAVTKGLKYLVCVDSRDESRVALRLACMKSKVRGHKVCLLHVTTPADFQTLGTIAERMREERKEEGQQLLATLAHEAYARYGTNPDLILRDGSAGDEIITTVDSDPAINMIALGIASQSTGRGKLAVWLAGQLGSKLFVPLMMIPGNLTDQQLQNLI